uniref:hypothetical protein n=1 Tax=Prevotella sp. TaxID=59823 RepID=UPI003FEFB549
MKKIILSLIALMAAVSTNAQVLEVYENGFLMKTYKNTTGAQYRFVFKSAGEDTSINDHEFVEIGGIKWATMNVGATTVADSWETSYGDFYAWGEIDTYYKLVGENDVMMGKETEKTHIPGVKSSYNFVNYSGTNNSSDTTTYNKFKEWTPAPYDASTNVLTAGNDVARKMWGGSWRMPTRYDFKSLIEACGGGDDLSILPRGVIEGGIYWIPGGTTLDGAQYNVAGVLFVAVKDITKRVFFPAVGYVKNDKRGGTGHSYYWTSSLYATDTSAAYNLNIYDGGKISSGNHILHRCFGMPVRPVSD